MRPGRSEVGQQERTRARRHAPAAGELRLEDNAVDSARGALEFIEQSGEADLVLSDVVLPGEMKGVELAKSLRAQKPALPVLLTSGYVEALSRTKAYRSCASPTAWPRSRKRYMRCWPQSAPDSWRFHGHSYGIICGSSRPSVPSTLEYASASNV